MKIKGKDCICSLAIILINLVILFSLSLSWLTHDIFYYLISVFAIPSIIILIGSLISALAMIDRKSNPFLINAITAAIYSSIESIFLQLTLTESELLQIIANTTIKSSDNFTVSLSQNPFGDFIISSFFFIAVSGIGTVIGLKFRRRK